MSQSQAKVRTIPPHHHRLIKAVTVPMHLRIDSTRNHGSPFSPIGLSWRHKESHFRLRLVYTGEQQQVTTGETAPHNWAPILVTVCKSTPTRRSRRCQPKNHQSGHYPKLPPTPAVSDTLPIPFRLPDVSMSTPALRHWVNSGVWPPLAAMIHWSSSSRLESIVSFVSRASWCTLLTRHGAPSRT